MIGRLIGEQVYVITIVLVEMNPPNVWMNVNKRALVMLTKYNC